MCDQIELTCNIKTSVLNREWINVASHLLDMYAIVLNVTVLILRNNNLVQNWRAQLTSKKNMLVRTLDMKRTDQTRASRTFWISKSKMHLSLKVRNWRTDHVKIERTERQILGTECYVKIYVNSKKVATSKAQKDPFQWDESFKTKVDFPSDGKISVQGK